QADYYNLIWRYFLNATWVIQLDVDKLRNTTINKKGLFMTMRHVCSWQHQSTSRGRWASKRLLMELVSHLGKKLLLPGLLYKMDMKNLQR
ncbi:hypothetical protein LEMLEM_LOCUS21456, partial [Lemmus lemmus]